LSNKSTLGLQDLVVKYHETRIGPERGWDRLGLVGIGYHELYRWCQRG